MRRIDELHLAHPFAGSRMLRDLLKLEGRLIGRQRVSRLMRKMGIEALYRKPNLSRRHSAHPIYRYPLRDLKIERSNQVWATDITYIPMRRGFVYLIAVIDGYSRKVLSWRLSNTMTTDFGLEAVQEAIATYGKPEIFNTDQGSQFTSHEFTQRLKDNKISISMDGKGCWEGNVFVERLWKSVKYEEVYLKAYNSLPEAKANLGAYLNFFNAHRPHQSLDGKTPDTDIMPRCRNSVSRHDVWITHRAARLPLDKSAGGGPVDNPIPQGYTYHRRFAVQLIVARSVGRSGSERSACKNRPAGIGD